VGKRVKKASKAYRDQFGHTPLSEKESIPWGGRRLIVATGQSGSLPITPGVWKEAERRGVEIVAAPTEEALSRLGDLETKDVHANVHVTC